MSAQSRREALQRRHAELEQQLHRITNTPLPDAVRARELKREKLRVKDEIEKLKSVA